MLENVKNYMEKFIVSLDEPRIEELYSRLPFGKQLRSKLILHVVDSEDSQRLCAIVELIHLASLLHDDVIDESKTRRGKESINSIFGDKTAIMLGDILYSKAFYELTFLPNEVARIVSSAVTKLSIGELLDVELSHNFNDNKSKYFDMIYKKTASLIEASASSAAFLAHKDVEKFATYGKNLGLAFQVVDDILDITSDSKTLGKPSLNDFKEGKTTLPYIYLHERLEDSEQTMLKSMFKKELSKDEGTWIKEKMQTTQALEDSIKKAKEYGMSAKNAIKDEALPKLDEIVTAMIHRSF